MIKYKVQKNVKPSIVELKIIKTLKQNNINFEREVMFDGCVNYATKKPLRYDFYLPEKNIIIEYDGKEYHRDNMTLVRDNFKTEWAKRNGFDFNRISGYHNLEIFFAEKFGIKEMFTKVSLSKSKPKFKPAQYYIDLIYSNKGDIAINEIIEMRKMGGLKIYNFIRKVIPQLNEYTKLKSLIRDKDELSKTLKSCYLVGNIVEDFPEVFDKLERDYKSESQLADLLEEYGKRFEK